MDVVLGCWEMLLKAGVILGERDWKCSLKSGTEDLKGSLKSGTDPEDVAGRALVSNDVNEA